MKSCILKVCSILMVVCILMTISLTGASAITYIVDDGFKFTRDSGGITIHGYEGTDENVVIPTTLLGESVTKINEYAFMHNDFIKSVTIPTSVTVIDRGVFYGCTALETVQLPKSCANIGQYLFYGCTSLKEVTLPTVLKEVPRYCFAYCDSLETVTLPSTAKIIGDYAFSNCPSLQSVYVSKYTSSISLTAFESSPRAAIFGYMNTYAYNFALENSIAFSAVNATADTLYVTFYDYDGSIFLKVPVVRGRSINFPTVVPQKPSTSTHYYEFSHWLGNVINIQQHEFVTPVYKEYEINTTPDVIPTYSVVFLDGNDVFMSVQSVEEGKAASEPTAVPQKAASESCSYVFAGWDTDFTNVTENLIVRPVFDEIPIEYRVLFVGKDGETIEELLATYGEKITAPDAPEVEGYNFIGWDKDFDEVKSDMVITALYEEIKVPAPQKTHGPLRVEISGGSGFTISVNSGAARPQGVTYTNTKTAVGTNVTVTAQSTSDAEFLGWINPVNGTVLSKELTYSFVTTGNDFIKASYAVDVEGVQMVAFKNDKLAGGLGRYIDLQYYSSGDEILIPEDPTALGYDFTGWSMSVDEIAEEISAGRNVVVVATWKRQEIKVNVTVVDGSGTGEYIANTAVTVQANEAPEGKKFAYWTDSQGNIRGYDTTYKFYPAGDTVLTAVFVDEDVEIDREILVFVDYIDTVSVANKNMFGYSWYVPSSYEFITAGLVAVNKDNYKEATFYAGSDDSNVYTKNPGGGTNVSSGFAVWVKSNVFAGDTWLAKTYVQYRNADGEVITVYSDVMQATKD